MTKCTYCNKDISDEDKPISVGEATWCSQLCQDSGYGEDLACFYQEGGEFSQRNVSERTENEK